MKRVFKIALYCMGFIVVLVCSYMYKLHSLAVEENNIFGRRCTEVNPYLIAYKNSFLSFADAVKNPNKYTVEQGRKFYFDYLDGMQIYYPKETVWLNENQKVLNRWDFKLIEPWYIQKAGDYQQKMYEAYRDEAQIMTETTVKGANVDDLMTKFKEARDRRNKYMNLYFGFSEEAGKIKDLRKLFGVVPVPPGCTEENVTIPDTTGALDAEPTPIPAKEPGITG